MPCQSCDVPANRCDGKLQDALFWGEQTPADLSKLKLSAHLVVDWELVPAMTEGTNPETGVEVALRKAVEDGLAVPAGYRLIAHNLR